MLLLGKGFSVSAQSLSVSSSANPSTYGTAVTFTVGVMTNGVLAANATGQVVFSFGGAPFCTNPIAAGRATSDTITNLPMGSDQVIAVYTGGNYPAATNTITQSVNAPIGPNLNASDDLAIYTDNLVNGFKFTSANATYDPMARTVPPHSGSYCLGITFTAGHQYVSLMRDPWVTSGRCDTTLFTNLVFWIHGGVGGQQVKVLGVCDGTNSGTYLLPSLAAGWNQVTVPLSQIGAANNSSFCGIRFQSTIGSAQPSFYVNDLRLTAAAAPAMVQLRVDATRALRLVDARHFGINTATWDGGLGNSAVLPLLRSAGMTALRWPGGATSESYHWATDPTGNANFRYLATNLAAQVFTIVNYGSGTAAEAAAWVRSANQTNNCRFIYWEIGNECYLSGATDNHLVPHDPYTYATNAVAYLLQMKAACPAVPIKVGVVVVPGEGSNSNNASHFAVNPSTGTTNYGWTPVVLSTMKSLGVLPDFLIHHCYPQETGTSWNYYSNSVDSDLLLLQSAVSPTSGSTWTDWASAAANLRQQITDYVGSAGTNIELSVTENNCNGGHMGRQSTSLLNGLYRADSTCQLLKTEFNTCMYWDLHNGPNTTGSFDPTLYGWRSGGDYGMLDLSNKPYPTYYAQKLLLAFARPGDTILDGTSDSQLLATYAALRTNGTLTLLVINKAMTRDLSGQIALANFLPDTNSVVLSYGLPQDEMARTNGPALLQDIATNSAAVSPSFAYTIPRMSLTLFTLNAAPPTNVWVNLGTLGN